MLHESFDPFPRIFIETVDGLDFDVPQEMVESFELPSPVCFRAARSWRDGRTFHTVLEIKPRRDLDATNVGELLEHTSSSAPNSPRFQRDEVLDDPVDMFDTDDEFPAPPPLEDDPIDLFFDAEDWCPTQETIPSTTGFDAPRDDWPRMEELCRQAIEIVDSLPSQNSLPPSSEDLFPWHITSDTEEVQPTPPISLPPSPQGYFSDGPAPDPLLADYDRYVQEQCETSPRECASASPGLSPSEVVARRKARRRNVYRSSQQGSLSGSNARRSRKTTRWPVCGDQQTQPICAEAASPVLERTPSPVSGQSSAHT